MTDLHFDAPTHTYRLNGRRVPSVTQITGTIAPLVGIPREVLEAKADLGTAVHLATEYHDQDDLDWDGLPDIVRPYLEAYARFRAETGFIPTRIEARVSNPTFAYAGTLDRIGTFARLKGVRTTAPCLVDLKATYRIAPIYGVQTALYAAAASPKKALLRFALQLKPDATYRLEQFADPSDLSVGLAALTLMNWRERHGENDL